MALAIADAHADVITCTREYGLVPVLLTLEPGEVTWEDSARGADMAQLNRLPPELWDTYYQAYGETAVARIRLLSDQSEARTARGERERI
jgi:hypothetical protein